MDSTSGQSTLSEPACQHHLPCTRRLPLRSVPRFGSIALRSGAWSATPVPRRPRNGPRTPDEEEAPLPLSRTAAPPSEGDLSFESPESDPRAASRRGGRFFLPPESDRGPREAIASRRRRRRFRRRAAGVRPPRDSPRFHDDRFRHQGFRDDKGATMIPSLRR